MTDFKGANRNNNMGVLHFIAAIFVMFGHQCALLGLPVPIILGSGIQSIGVKIIFIISGYLITQSLWNIKGKRINATKTYLLKRLSRIYPEFIGCLLVSVLIIGPLFTNLPQAEYWNNLRYYRYITANIRMYPIYSLPGVFTENPYPNAVNGSLWTLPIEMFLYVFILIIFLISSNSNVKRNIYGITSLGVLILSIIRIALFPGASLVFYGTDWIQGLDIMPYFLIGGIAKLFPVKKYLNVQVGAVMFLSLAWIFFDVEWINEVVCFMVLSYFILSLALADVQILHFRWIKSEYAYGIYLYGFVVQQCVISKYISLCDSLNKWVAFAISAIVTYILAMLSYKLFYCTMHRFIKRRMK